MPSTPPRASGLDRRKVGSKRALEVTGVHLFVLERQMDDAIRGRNGFSKTVEIIERAPMHVGAQCLDCVRRAVRSGQTHDLVAGFDQFGDNGGSKMA
jgi:hypothetical protein